MKYFTYDLWRGISDSIDAWHEQCEQYSKEFELAKGRLPERLVDKLEKCCFFHDAAVTDIKFGPYLYTGNSSSLEINLIYIEQKYALKYFGVIELKYSKLVDNQMNITLNDRKLLMGYDEFLPVSENLTSHEILFDNGDTVLIVFDKLKLFAYNKFGRMIRQ